MGTDVWGEPAQETVSHAGEAAHGFLSKRKHRLSEASLQGPALDLWSQASPPALLHQRLLLPELPEGRGPSLLQPPCSSHGLVHGRQARQDALEGGCLPSGITQGFYSNI